jgi:hypothetical protein
VLCLAWVLVGEGERENAKDGGVCEKHGEGCRKLGVSRWLGDLAI